MARVEVLEWWPDYGGVLLHRRAGRGGQPVDLAGLVLSDDLRSRLRAWLDDYGDERLPLDGNGDPAWLAAGTALLGRVRQELATTHTVVVTEPWWGEPPVTLDDDGAR